MSVIGFLSTAPVVEDSMAAEVASAVEALDEHDVEYETGPMGTTIEAETTDDLFAAVQAAHDAIDADRVSTILKIDDRRDVDRRASEKVAAVEDHLGRPAASSSE